VPCESWIYKKGGLHAVESKDDGHVVCPAEPARVLPDAFFDDGCSPNEKDIISIVGAYYSEFNPRSFSLC